MARHREFDTAAVVAAAQEIFWARGYRATTLDMITERTGVNKPSLAAAFGDKCGLFRRVLAQYHRVLLEHARVTLSGHSDPADAITSWLESFLPALTSDDPRGCLSVNASLELALGEPTIAADIAEYNKALEELVRRTLRRSDPRPPSSDVRGTARAIMALYTGLFVIARNRPSAPATRAAVERAARLVRT